MPATPNPFTQTADGQDAKEGNDAGRRTDGARATGWEGETVPTQYEETATMFSPVCHSPNFPNASPMTPRAGDQGTPTPSARKGAHARQLPRDAEHADTTVPREVEMRDGLDTLLLSDNSLPPTPARENQATTAGWAGHATLDGGFGSGEEGAAAGAIASLGKHLPTRNVVERTMDPRGRKRPRLTDDHDAADPGREGQHATEQATDILSAADATNCTPNAPGQVLVLHDGATARAILPGGQIIDSETLEDYVQRRSSAAIAQWIAEAGARMAGRQEEVGMEVDPLPTLSLTLPPKGPTRCAIPEPGKDNTLTTARCSRVGSVSVLLAWLRTDGCV
ncbi:hypothetical protein GY45DRAFT_1410034 [Cubamyces sp. BRFM 1775]|nr:hypothetical protein GY45DRAFT_1410034 [Cubamyces sp. BRFM 1775]